MDIFYSDDHYEVYLQLLKEQSKRSGLEILSYCLMSNHVHIIAVPSKEDSLAKAIGETHRLYTRKINFEQNVKGHLFQERFFSSVLDEIYFYNCLRYVEQNPVTAKIVKQAWQYPYSSTKIRMNLEEDKLGILSDYDWLSQLGDYKMFIKQVPKDIDFIEEKTRTGRPCADESFYDYIEQQLGKNLKPKKAGRPKKDKNND